ncbi:hypothetical protein ACFXPX_33970 [Kitasatospora sp. NPDC059146]|uniref:hypothetical protein n=1 Tax=unclassified Kitasatospora TaxID=2633591 RepID=UPI0036B18760
MKRPRRTLGCSVAAVVVLATGVGLFYNGYGPMALMDRGAGLLSPSEAKAQLDETLRAAMAAISPPLAYSGGSYIVDRRQEHADGEPNLRSDVREVALVRTKVVPAKVPVLLDRMTQFWGGDCRRSDTTTGSQTTQYTQLHCPGRGSTLVTVSVTTVTADSAVTVDLSADAFGVYYRSEQDYGAPPIGEREAGRSPAPDVDDPYWSH